MEPEGPLEQVQTSILCVAVKLNDDASSPVCLTVFSHGNHRKMWLATVTPDLPVLQVMCSLQHGAMTPNLHFDQLNPHIDLHDSRLAVPTAVRNLGTHAWIKGN